ncbi:MAG: ABC transporter ATP-binding protein, partial [Mesorhizobium sp.]|nr:ABC transporter ATP-binding protein [Mesorhizobium sp.]
MARLILDNVGKSFAGADAVKDVSIDVADGEFLAVLGPSGCGKTTLLRLVAGFEKLTRGEIR